MKTETHLYKNKKTLAWLRDSPAAYKLPERLSRWDTIVTSWEAAEEWKSVFGLYPNSILLTEPTSETLQWIATKAPKERNILFLSRKIMKVYGVKTFTTESFLNVICLEEIAEMYPHTTHVFQQGETMAITVMVIAALFRVARVVGVSEADLVSSECSEYANQLKESYGLQMDIVTREPEALWLLQQYYIPTNTKRAKELKHCLEVNLKNPFLDKILLLNETDLQSVLPKHPKLNQQVIGHRLQYADIVQTIQTQVPEDVLVAFANSDIYLDHTWRQLWSVELKDTFLSLLRYEEPVNESDPPVIFGISGSSALGRADSQDTWVLHSSSVKNRTWDLKTLQFEFGRAGCDNAINVELLRKKFVVANPALSLQTIHCHASEFRTYNSKDIIEKPVYLYLDPTGIHDLRPLHDLSPYKLQQLQAIPFSRRVQSIREQSLKTLCSMVSRQEKILLQYDSDNMYIPQTVQQLYQFESAFTTPNGLVYGYDSIYLGKTDALRKAWASTKISHMTTCIGIQSVIAAPLSDQDAKNLFHYILKYLSIIFRIKAMGVKGDFWMPSDTPRLQEFLQYFKWDDKVIPVVPRDKEIVVYSKTATMLPPQESSMCEKEDIEALRSNLRIYLSEPSLPNRVVIFQDDSFFSDEDVLAMESTLEEKGYDVTIVYPSRSTPSYILSRTLGRAICITGPKQEGLFWILPRGARVIEVQSELQIMGEGVHMAGAASLEYWTILLARAKLDIRRKILVEQIVKTVDAVAAAEKRVEETQSKPLLLLPKGFTGFHGHTGDSFREMAALWFSKGFVDLEYTTESPYLWLDGIGQTLLYDRATFQWLNETPATYKQILCGNPDASKVPNGIQWSFWPRRPALVEQRVEQGLPTYEERTDTLVFYGKVENGIQERHRNNKLHEACDEFFMPLGVEKQYAFDQETYLNKLASAKFGLCMAGFGPKCNREIECMALGTVPVVAPDVDMDHYAVPPQEGVHYLRLKSYDPEDALALVRSTSQDAWVQLSMAAHGWWKANASSEGLWALTRWLLDQPPH
jgi:hypothetical protein